MSRKHQRVKWWCTHLVTKYFLAAALASDAMCAGIFPSTASIMAKCSRFSCVWKSASPAQDPLSTSSGTWKLGIWHSFCLACPPCKLFRVQLPYHIHAQNRAKMGCSADSGMRSRHHQCQQLPGMQRKCKMKKCSSCKMICI